MVTWLIVAFVALDVVTMLAVGLYIVKKRGGFSNALGFDPVAVAAVSREMEVETGEFLRSNWSGDPLALAGPIGELLSRFEQKAREHGLPLEREQLKRMLARLIEHQRLASSHDVREAMKQVA